jgi:hypothetical protein
MLGDRSCWMRWAHHACWVCVRALSVFFSRFSTGLPRGVRKIDACVSLLQGH